MALRTSADTAQASWDEPDHNGKDKLDFANIQGLRLKMMLARLANG